MIAPCLRYDYAINNARLQYVNTINGTVGCCATLFAVGATTKNECESYSGSKNKFGNFVLVFNFGSKFCMW